MKVAARPDAVMCKHELAAMLAHALHRSESIEKEDGAWATELKHRLHMAMIQHGV